MMLLANKKQQTMEQHVFLGHFLGVTIKSTQLLHGKVQGFFFQELAPYSMGVWTLFANQDCCGVHVEYFLLVCMVTVCVFNLRGVDMSLCCLIHVLCYWQKIVLPCP